MIGRDSNYPYTMTRLLVGKVAFTGFDRVIFTGNERIIKDLREQYSNETFLFSTLPHAEFIKELAQSRVSLLVGGIQSTIEAFSLLTPTVFLPPSNVSQYGQILGYRRNKVAHLSIHLQDYLEKLPLTKDDERTLMSKFFAQWKQIEHTEWILDDIAKRIRDYLADEDLLRIQVYAQKMFIQSLKVNGL